MKIFIVGAGNPIPSFVGRRLNALAARRVPLVVSLDYNQKHDLHSSIEVLRYGNFKGMRLPDLKRYISLLITQPHIFIRLWRLNNQSSFLNRVKTTLKYFPLATVRNVSLIHLQWLTLVSGVPWLRQLYGVPLLASVRGSQVTVYPYTRPKFSAVVTESIQGCDALHLVSKDMMKPCIDLGAHVDNMFVNYNGVDLKRFVPPETRTPSSVLRLVSVGAVMWRKGYLFQLDIVRRLKAYAEVHLTIAGGGPDVEGLLYMAHKLGVQQEVTFCGQVDERRLIALLQESDVYISTSAAEGLSNSCMEAAACGLPVVSFSCEGASELIEDKVSGYVVPYGDTQAFTDALQLLMDPVHREDLGRRARQKVERDFNADFWLEEMIGKYRELGLKSTDS